MRCFIFSAGSFYGLRELPATDDFIIAADAGRLTCEKLKIAPNLIVGDFDSAPRPKQFKDVIVAPVEKDDTDTMLSVKEGLRRGCRIFYLYGATGGTRLDHTLANLQTLSYLRAHNARGYLYDRDFVYTVLESESLTVAQTVKWGLLSLFALGEKAEGVTLEGVQYPLTDGTVSGDFPLCVSNHIVEKQAKITVKSGKMLVGWELPPLPNDDFSEKIH